MLSEVILSRHSYPAMPLAGQQVHQRSVHSGPLVTCFARRTARTSRRLTRKLTPCFQECRLYLSPIFIGELHITRASSRFLWSDSSMRKSSDLNRKVVTGSIMTSHGIALKRVLVLKQIITHWTVMFIILGLKPYEGSTVMSNIFNHDYSWK